MDSLFNALGFYRRVFECHFCKSKNIHIKKCFYDKDEKLEKVEGYCKDCDKLMFFDLKN